MTDPSGIVNWLRIDARITTSGQPAAHELGGLQALGVTQVINLGLHTHERALADEAGSLAALGMTYTHIPVDFQAPTEADYQRFCEAVRGSGAAPLHVHCIMNYRVTAFFFRYRTEFDGVPVAEARAMMEQIWRPGGVWAAFTGDKAAFSRDHLYAGKDYPRSA